MQFIADTMLGKLAKWLRFMGYDTLYPKDLDDRELVELTRSTDRILLTRDKELSKVKNLKVLYIKDENADEQLNQIIKEYDLTLTGDEFSRCPECNNTLKDVKRSDLSRINISNIPVGVLERHDQFWYCDSCEQYYWRGTHYEKIQEKLNDLLT